MSTEIYRRFTINRLKYIWYIGASCWFYYRNILRSTAVWTSRCDLSTTHDSELRVSGPPFLCQPSSLVGLPWTDWPYHLLQIRISLCLWVLHCVFVYIETCALPWASEKKCANRSTCVFVPVSRTFEHFGSNEKLSIEDVSKV